jgi:hypothetical protein
MWCRYRIAGIAPREGLGTRPTVDWLEVYAENSMGGCLGLAALKRLRWDTPIPALAVLLGEVQTAERYPCELEAAHYADIT